jgi:hypothetical protein
MRVGGAFGLKATKKIPPGTVVSERQAHLQVWPFHPDRFVVNEAAHDAVEETIGRLKTGDQELLDTLLNVVGQKGGQHGLSLQLPHR